MGWCHEFGSQIGDGCDHPMTAGTSSCRCEQCGVVCEGRFAGCATVWAAGPREVPLARVASDDMAPANRPARSPAAPVIDEVSPIDVAPAPSRRLEAVAADRHPVDPGADADVLAWLRSAFDGVRAELRVLGQAVDRQERAMARTAEASEAAARLAELADGLPERIAAAVTEALATEQSATLAHVDEVLDQVRQMAVSSMSTGPGRDADGGDELRDLLPDDLLERPARSTSTINRVDAVADELRQSLAEVHASASELRNEMVRLAAFRQALADDLPTVASAVDAASRRADGRLSELTERVNDLASRPEWEEALRSLQMRRGGNSAET